MESENLTFEQLLKFKDKVTKVIYAGQSNFGVVYYVKVPDYEKPTLITSDVAQIICPDQVIEYFESSAAWVTPKEVKMLKKGTYTQSLLHPSKIRRFTKKRDAKQNIAEEKKEVRCPQIETILDYFEKEGKDHFKVEFKNDPQIRDMTANVVSDICPDKLIDFLEEKYFTLYPNGFIDFMEKHGRVKSEQNK